MWRAGLAHAIGSTAAQLKRGASCLVDSRLRGWLAAALLLPLLACEAPEKKAATQYERGVALYEEGEDAKAMVEFPNVLRLDPKNADAIYRTGLIHERAGRLAEAYGAFRQAVEERPGLVAAQVKLGSLALAGNELEAAAAAAAIEKAEPGNLDGMTLKAALALRNGETQAALDLASAVLVEEPERENAVAVLVGAYHRLGETERALARLDEALAANAASVSLRLLKITLLNAETDDVEAILATYDELIALQPTDVFSRLSLAAFLEGQDEVAGAASVLRQAIADGIAAPQVAEGLVRLVHEAEGLDAAAAELEALIEADPDNHARRFLLADLYRNGGRQEDAEGALAAIAARAEDRAVADQARAAIAQVRLAAGNTEGARALASEVLAGDGEQRGANLVLGLIALDEGDFDEAIRSARVALREDPDWLPGLRLAAEGYLGKGATDLALDVLRQIVKLDPRGTRYAEVLAQLLTQRGEYEAALDAWDQVAHTAEDPSGALFARAAIELRRGGFAAAQADIEHLLATPGREFAGALLSGDLLLAQRRFEDSRQWFAKAQSAAPEAPHPLRGMVATYVAADDVEGALAFLAQRIEDKPDDTVGFFYRGELLAGQGKLEEAGTAFRETIRLHPEWLIPYQRLGAVLLQGGEEAEAIRVYREALQQSPDDPDLLNGLAMAHYTGGDPEGAIATYARLIEVQPDLEVAINNYAAMIADSAYEDQELLAHALELAARFRASDNADFLDTLGWLHYRRANSRLPPPFSSGQ